ncbi:unnamed protein product [Ambrosiozyma monospora]|uniref:Unnamed protein product n=1 Tax=Ambrosiozyma monospora TaxID=43982 RepID=A0A9W7DKX8_AMBMO|nr:unnamed protein product [Ambrosiozyma monospora]
MIPGGCVHVPNKLAAKAAKLIDVKFAPAAVGFDFGGKKSRMRGNATVRIEGVVVSDEFEEAVLEVCSYLEEQEQEEKTRRKELLALRAWKLVLAKLKIQKRLNEEHGEIEDGGKGDQSDDGVADDSVEEGGGFVGQDEHYGDYSHIHGEEVNLDAEIGEQVSDNDGNGEGGGFFNDNHDPSDDNGGFLSGSGDGGFSIEHSNNGDFTAENEGGFDLAEENGGFMVETEENLYSKASKDHDVSITEDDNDCGFVQDPQNSHDSNSDNNDGGFLVSDEVTSKQDIDEDTDDGIEITGEHKCNPEEAPYKDIQPEFTSDQLPQQQDEDDGEDDQEGNNYSILADPRNYMNLDDDDLAYDSSNVTTEKPQNGRFQLTVVPGPSSASTKPTTRAVLVEVPDVPKQGTSRDDPINFSKHHDHDTGMEKGEENVSDSDVSGEPEEESDGDDDTEEEDGEDGEEYEFEYSDSE